MHQFCMQPRIYTDISSADIGNSFWGQPKIYTDIGNADKHKLISELLNKIYSNFNSNYCIVTCAPYIRNCSIRAILHDYS